MYLKRKIREWETMDEREKQAIVSLFSFKDPKTFFYGAVNKSWSDGTICLMNKKTGEIPFGLIDSNPELLEYDLEKVLCRKFPSSLNFSEHIRPYQKDAIKTFYEKRFGIIKVPTGGGKTVLATEVMKIAINEYGKEYRCLFLVDQIDLLKQSSRVFSSSLPDLKVGIYRTGKLRDYKDHSIIVTSIQTLQAVLNRKVSKFKKVKKRDVKKTKQEYEKDLLKSNNEKKFLIELLRSVRMTLIDEVQFFGSKDRSNLILDYLDGTEFLLALSATPLRSDDLIASKRIIGFTGGVIYQIKEKVLVDEEFLAKRRVLMLYHQVEDITKFLEDVNIKKIFRRVNEDGIREYTEIPRYNDFYRNFIIRNKRRNDMILDVIGILKGMKLNTLVLVNRRSHGILLSKVTGIKFIDGGTNQQSRDFHKSKLQEGEGNILIASSIFNKGVDIPAINVVFNVGAGKNEENTIQKKGRVLRRVVGDSRYDKAMIIDIYDDAPKTFGDHSDMRLATYRLDVEEDDIVFVEYKKRGRQFINHVTIELNEWFGKR